jgi:hypothetical protein
VTHVSTRQKYAEGVNNRKVFLNLKRIKRLFVAKYRGGVNAKSAVVGKSRCLKEQEKNLKKYIRHPKKASPFIVLFVIEQSSDNIKMMSC